MFLLPLFQQKVQLIAQAKIECTWFVQIWVCGAIVYFIFTMLMQSCKILWCDYVECSTQCATLIFVWTWMHVYLKVFACLCVCLRKFESALYTNYQNLMSILHKLELKELARSYGIKHEEIQNGGSLRLQFFSYISFIKFGS